MNSRWQGGRRFLSHKKVKGEGQERITARSCLSPLLPLFKSFFFLTSRIDFDYLIANYWGEWRATVEPLEHYSAVEGRIESRSEQEAGLGKIVAQWRCSVCRAQENTEGYSHANQLRARRRNWQN